MSFLKFMAAIQRGDIFKTIFARVQFYIIDRGLDDTCTALAYTFAEYEAYSKDLVVAILQLLCDPPKKYCVSCYDCSSRKEFYVI